MPSRNDNWRMAVPRVATPGPFSRLIDVIDHGATLAQAVEALETRVDAVDARQDEHAMVIERLVRAEVETRAQFESFVRAVEDRFFKLEASRPGELRTDLDDVIAQVKEHRATLVSHDEHLARHDQQITELQHWCGRGGAPGAAAKPGGGKKSSA